MFDFRVLFLFTALCPEQRELARHNHGAVPILLQVGLYSSLFLTMKVSFVAVGEEHSEILANGAKEGAGGV